MSYLCGRALRGRVWEYRPASRKVVDVTAEASESAARYCSALRTAPLDVHFEASDAAIFWKLGPYRAGMYSFVLDRAFNPSGSRARTAMPFGRAC